MILKQFEVSHVEEQVGKDPAPGFTTYLQQMRVQGMSWTAEIDGKFVARAGLIPLWAGVAQAWMTVSDTVILHKIPLARKLRRQLSDQMWLRSIYRAQADIHAKHERAIRLVEWLGFENEGLMRRFGAEGDDYFRYAKVTNGN